MIELELIPLGRRRQGSVRWDPETGALEGPLADELRELAAMAARERAVTGAPYPTTYPVSREPLKSHRDLALIISLRWQVPAALVDHLPEQPPLDDEPDSGTIVY